MAVLTGVLLPVAIRPGRRITRGEGAFLLLLFTGYPGWRVYGVLRPF